MLPAVLRALQDGYISLWSLACALHAIGQHAQSLSVLFPCHMQCSHAQQCEAVLDKQVSVAGKWKLSRVLAELFTSTCAASSEEGCRKSRVLATAELDGRYPQTSAC